MEKKYIIQFLKEKKRGVYTLIVNTYVDVISAMGVTMALRVIKDDLEKETGTQVELNYFSLAKAVSKLEKKVTKHSTTVVTRQWNFKDTNEMKGQEERPGSFKLRQ
ncbi:hypothetical protein [Chryseolinea lacunae]|uniref:Uncharacterized protein n=1 Tax=Chryseolinea lacunae TaxID=2801331 RepID=A0ABS1L296_9BACT|nr:hypothetical protein [Chryseolinea lacunae]MBL0745700.1 hypothetical protein [Chryseolinea lacunae]